MKTSWEQDYGDGLLTVWREEGSAYATVTHWPSLKDRKVHIADLGSLLGPLKADGPPTRFGRAPSDVGRTEP